MTLEIEERRTPIDVWWKRWHNP